MNIDSEYDKLIMEYRPSVLIVSYYQQDTVSVIVMGDEIQEQNQFDQITKNVDLFHEYFIIS